MESVANNGTNEISTVEHYTNNKEIFMETQPCLWHNMQFLLLSSVYWIWRWDVDYMVQLCIGYPFSYGGLAFIVSLNHVSVYINIRLNSIMFNIETRFDINVSIKCIESFLLGKIEWTVEGARIFSYPRASVNCLEQDVDHLVQVIFTCIFLNESILTHKAETKWPPFRRRRFQRHFLEWKCLNSD